MSSGYWKFPRHPVSTEQLKMGGINDIIFHYHYRVGPKIGKGVCDLCRIPCECTAFVAQLGKYWLPTIVP